MTNLTPIEIVNELNRFIVGQSEAKKAVANALRSRWRRSQLPKEIQDEILPKNILMVGPTGVGKTEIARRLAKLAQAPFLKVEATKFTEIGYVGRDVDQIIRDLIEISIGIVKNKLKEEVKLEAKKNVDEKILDALIGSSPSQETKAKFRRLLQNNELDEKEIEIQVQENPALQIPTIDIQGIQGPHIGMLNLNELLGRVFNKKSKLKKMTVLEAREFLAQEEVDKLLDQERIIKESIELAEQKGIVFIDEIDKICLNNSSKNTSRDVSREGVQRDLLPLLEGTTINTKFGPIKTDHILFIASGAFYISKPSDLLPELQGRLPIRVELNPLNEEDFVRILKEPETNLIYQAKVMMLVENIELIFPDESISKLAALAVEINNNVENIGARRLQTVLEKLLEDISFYAPDHHGKTITITQSFIEDQIKPLLKNKDLSRFIL